MLTGSSPLNGSSRIKRSGSWMIAATNWIFCSMPFESSSQRLPSTPASPTRATYALMRSESPLSGTPLRRAMYMRYAATRILRYTPRSSGRYPILSFASSAESRPSTLSSPLSGNRIDMIIRIDVVLPAPFGPMKP